MTDETRLSGTYGSDIDPFDDIQVEDVYYPAIDNYFDIDEPAAPIENTNDDNTYGYDFYDYLGFNDEPDLWIDDVTEDFPF